MQLIVLDDDPLTREMVVASARAHGIDAIPAATISEADALLDEAAGEIAILSDVDLRCEQTGIEASLKWAKTLDGSRILLMQAHHAFRFGVCEAPRVQQELVGPSVNLVEWRNGGAKRKCCGTRGSVVGHSLDRNFRTKFGG